VSADDPVCVATANARFDGHDGNMAWKIKQRDLTCSHDRYTSVHLISVSVYCVGVIFRQSNT
jgi:hypothetical protein